MHQTDTPLYATPCLGATIAHVHVFPTHVVYQQRLGGDITVASDTIVAVEKHVYEHGFVILRAISRRRIICMVPKKRVNILYAAIRDAHCPTITTRTPPASPPKE